ncbi:MAG: hypothetical protein AB9861_14670 [Methanosarcina sp.]
MRREKWKTFKKYNLKERFEEERFEEERFEEERFEEERFEEGFLPSFECIDTSFSSCW